jgi:hypothetical protein
MVSTRIRHRVHFAPNPENPSFGTEPVIVETRRVCDIAEFPAKVNYIFFDDVVETIVRLPDGTTKTLYTKPVNEELFFVKWDEISYRKTLTNGSAGEVAVHPTLQGKIWVIASQSRQLEGQKAA